MKTDHPGEGGGSWGTCREAAAATDFPFWAVRLQNPSPGQGSSVLGEDGLGFWGPGLSVGGHRAVSHFWVSCCLCRVNCRPDCWLEWRW